MDLKNIKGKVDFGIITIKEEEFEAVLRRFPKQDEANGERYYNLSYIKTDSGDECLVAVVRCNEQGGKEGLKVTYDIIEDLSPKWIVLTGIAGGVPADEFSLGDVVVSTRLHDFSVKAVLEGGRSEYALGGGRMLKRVRNLASNLPAMKENLRGWNDETSIGMPRPPVVIEPSRLYGNTEWQEKVKESLERHFGTSVLPRPPKVVSGVTGSSDSLVKDSELIRSWKDSARQVVNVEMELHGVYEGAERTDREYPVLAIRGISDIVGFKRDSRWTEYACETAASLTHALIKSGYLRSSLLAQPNTPTDDYPSSLYKEMNEKKCVIYDHKKNEHILPLELPGLSKRTGIKAWENAEHWKRVHTLTGGLYERYLDFHISVIRYDQTSQPEADTHRRYAQEHLKRLRDEFDEFKKCLAQLPPTVSMTETVKVLRKIHLCTEPMMHSLVSPKDSPEFKNGLKLIEAVGGWLLRALRIADSIIEMHFSKQRGAI